MNCPACGTPQPPEARFCMSCGARLSGAGTPAGAGRSTDFENLRRLVPAEYADQLLAAGGAARGERRVVTILFLDVAGSTAMSENLDPEDVMEIMNGAFATLVQPILRYGGTLARLTGDGVLAFFGAPIAHEDDPQRACRAALDILEHARQYGEQLRARRRIDGFNVRVGLNTGLVVVGEVGSDLRVEYTAMGDAVNLAARMESAAEPGTVVLTGHTRELAGNLFAFEDLGSVNVKGKARPVNAYRLIGPAKKTAREPAPSISVGRNGDLARVQAAVDAAVAGRGGLLAITGEPGVGKSRLIAEARAQSPGAEWVTISCASYGQTSSYQSVREILFRLISASEILPDESAYLLDDALRDGVQPDVTPARMRERTVEILRDCIRSRAAEKPLVVVLDDIQWADRPSLEAIAEVLPIVDESPVLFVLSCRPGGETSDIFERILEGRENVRVHVGPLEEREAAQLLDTLLAGHDLPAPARSLILQTAEGNPYFIHEVVRSVIELGLAEGALSGGLPHLSHMAIPTTVRGAIMARLDRLSHQERQILQTAAVIGRAFDADLLVEVLEPAVDRTELDRVLEDLSSRGFIHSAPADSTARGAAFVSESAPHSRHFVGRVQTARGRYIFRDPMTTEVCYKSQLRTRRRTMHRLVGEAMERGCAAGTRSCGVSVLAYHFDKAGEVERAVVYLNRAAENARKIGEVREAEAFERRVLELTKPE